MRRKVITTLIVAVILLGLSALEQVSVRRITDDALEQTRQILDAIRENALDEALEKTHALDQAWDRKANGLEMIIDHGSTDDVRFALSRLIAALEADDRATAMVYACELEGGIEHVMERQELLPQNIL